MIRGAGAERTGERCIPTITRSSNLAAASPAYRTLVLLATFTGFRRGELFGLRRCDVDFDHHTVTVAVQRQQLANGEHLIGEPKSDAGRRTVAPPPEAWQPLVDHLDRCTGPGGRGLS